MTRGGNSDRVATHSIDDELVNEDPERDREDKCDREPEQVPVACDEREQHAQRHVARRRVLRRRAERLQSCARRRARVPHAMHERTGTGLGLVREAAPVQQWLRVGARPPPAAERDASALRLLLCLLRERERETRLVDGLRLANHLSANLHRVHLHVAVIALVVLLSATSRAHLVRVPLAATADPHAERWREASRGRRLDVEVDARLHSGDGQPTARAGRRVMTAARVPGRHALLEIDRELLCTFAMTARHAGMRQVDEIANTIEHFVVGLVKQTTDFKIITNVLYMYEVK